MKTGKADPDGEDNFELLRKRMGLVLAPLAFVIVWFLPLDGLSVEAHRLMAILCLVGIFWMTETIPLPIASVIGVILCVITGIATARSVFVHFGHPVTLLLIGSFILAEALFHHGLNTRIAYQILGMRWVGASQARLLMAFGAIGCFLSMWMSNTVCTAMMAPVAITILKEIARRRSLQIGTRIEYNQLKFGVALLLMTGLASGVGGLGTPIGTAPNLVTLAFIEESTKVSISFFQWVAFALPLVIALIAFITFYFSRMCPAENGLMEGTAEWIRTERERLGPLSRGEKNVLWIFGVTVALWLLPGMPWILGGTGSSVHQFLKNQVPESVTAMIGVALLFLVPVDLRKHEFTLSWREAKRIDWGIILLFGGGLALGDLAFSTGLSDWIGSGLAEAANAHTTLGLVILFTLLAGGMTQSCNHSAATAMLVPAAIAVAQAAGVDPLQPALAAGIASSLGCMTPVSTPPMAIVYGSGCVPITQMMKHGLALYVVGAVLIIVTVMWVVPVVL